MPARLSLHSLTVPHRTLAISRRVKVALVTAVSVVVVLSAIVVGTGWWARVRVEQAIAHRIDQRLPGAEASVSIGSFPLLVHLATSGTILESSVHVRQVSAGPFVFNGTDVGMVTFDDVNIHVDDLHLRRDDLLHHRVVIDRVRDVTITAVIRQESLDKSVGLPITLGRGTVGIGGLTLPAALSIQARKVTITVPRQISFTFGAPRLDVFPCAGTIRIVPSSLRLSCVLSRLPPVLADTTFRF